MAVYSIHPIRSSMDGHFIPALTIYAETIPEQIRTATNEIIAWLDLYNDRFGPDSFHVMALLKDGEVIGYFQYAVFPATRLIAVDYLCIAKAERRGTGVFCTFVDLIIEYLNVKHRDMDMVLEAIDLPVYGKRFMELLRRTGFQVLPEPYEQPALGSMPKPLSGWLMIYPGQDVSLERSKAIRHCLKVNHYKRWYSYLKL
jgi:hypothetical protein